MRATPGVGALALVVAAAVIPPTSVGAATRCGPIGDTSPAEHEFPSLMSSLVGVDIRTGRHDCFERVVVEFGGTGSLPGYRVAYEADPILDSPRGEPVDIAGAATLVVAFGAWMPEPDGAGYSGPREFVPDNVSNIVELEQLENFEGMSSWAIGLDAERPFAVSTLSDPPRLVIDIAVEAAPSAPPASPVLPPTR